jgi:branched-chain amino acid transport system ATP-binding protein
VSSTLLLTTAAASRRNTAVLGDSRPLLAVGPLSAWYGEAQVLFDVRLEVRSGEIVGLLGRNGAGKSSLLRTVARVHRASRGAIVFDGEDVARVDANRLAARGMSFVREGARVISSLSVEDVLNLGRRLARVRGVDPHSLDEVWGWFPILAERRGVRAGYLSGGQRQALLLATALVSRPRMLLLDEPSAGLAPPVARALFDTLRELCSGELTVLIAEQNPHWLTGLVSRAYLLETGHVLEERRSDQLVGDRDVVMPAAAGTPAGGKGGEDR